MSSLPVPARLSASDANDLLSLCRLFVEMTTTGSSGAHLDGLLERMVALMSRVPRLGIMPYAAVLLRDRRGTLVEVATHGYRSEPWEVGLQHRLPGVQGAAPDERIRVIATDAPLDGIPANQAFLVLPIRDDRVPLGYACLGIVGDWTRSAQDEDFLANLSRALAGVITRCLTAETLRVREIELEETRTEAMRRLGTASEYRDDDSGLHVMRMAYFAAAIGRAHGLPETETERLLLTAQMHDIGKIGVPDAILLKPGPLTPDEYEVMKQHATIGERLLSGDDELMKSAREIAVGHHERWDGAGYPHGIAGEKIPLTARICSIADVFDALTTRRTYKEAWTAEDSIAWIRAGSGTRFDPALVAAFDTALPELLRIMALYGDDIIDPEVTLDQLRYAEAPTPGRWVSWTADLSVGIPTIDEHHRYLFDLTNALHEAVAGKRGIREAARVLRALTHYVRVHFRAEERLMESRGFEGLPRQQVQHFQFEEMLREFHRAMLAHPLTAPYEMLRYLRHWLVNHIRHEDRQLAQLRPAAAH